MGLTLKETGGTFELCPAETHQARCYIVADLGSQMETFNGETKLTHKLAIVWELSAKMSDGRPFAISKIYTASLHEKANLRKVLDSWRGRPFTADELEGFSMAKVVGTSCFVNVIHEVDKQGRDRAKISSIMALPRGVPTLPSVNDVVYFDFGNFDEAAFSRLPEWMREMIKKSPEYQSANNGGYPPMVDDVPPMVDDEPPAF